MMRDRYIAQLRTLIGVLPTISTKTVFALNGGNTTDADDRKLRSWGTTTMRDMDDPRADIGS